MLDLCVYVRVTACFLKVGGEKSAEAADTSGSVQLFVMGVQTGCIHSL